MFNSLRYLGWGLSLVVHLLVLIGGAYVSTGTHVKINLDKRVYEVDLVGPANKGKPGARSAPKLASAGDSAPKKAVRKEAPPAKETEAQKKPIKKAAPVDDSKKAIPQETVNATKEEPKKEEPKPTESKKEEPKKEEPKKEEPKKEEPKKKDASETKTAAKDTGKNATKADSKAEKKQSKEEILAQALGDVGKQAKSGKGSGSEGSAKGDSRGTAKNALADALADAGRDVSGRAGSGDGTSGEGDGEGESMGTLDQWYATQAIRAIRENWRFARLSSEVLSATVELRLNSSGEILSFRLTSGSGRVDFDSSVQRAIEDTKKLPPLPEGLGPTIVITFYNSENE